MAQIHFGPKKFISNVKQQPQDSRVEFNTAAVQDVFENSTLILQNRISELEYQLEHQDPVIIEKIIPVEVIKEKLVDRPFEVRVIEEKFIEKLVDRVIEVEKEVKVIEERIVEKLIEVPTELIKYVDKLYVPIWLIILVALQALLELYLILK